MASLPVLLVQRAKQDGDRKVALREKEFAIWREVTWQEYLEKVKALSFGLAELGVKKGDVVCFISDNRPEWIYTEVAAQSIGAVSLGLYSDMENLEQIHYLLDFSDARIVVAENQEQTDKILAVRDRLPKLSKIIVDEFDEVDDYSDPMLVSFAEVLRLGAKAEAENKGLFEKKVAEIDDEDVALMSTTSGTTALPKLALLTHKNLMHMARGVEEVDPTREGDEFVSFLPPAWVGERMISLAWALLSGFTVNFPERPETVRRDLREIGPSIYLAPPRIWEKMLADVLVKVQDASAMKRKVYDVFLSLSEKLLEGESKSKRRSLYEKMLGKAGDVFVFRKLRDHLGLSRLRIVYTGGAPLGDDTFRFFQSMGVKIKQVYGQTEVAGIAALHRSDDVRVESVGEPIPGTHVKITDAGEILLKSDAVCRGYYKNAKATREAIVDGWLRTGDQGYLDEGHLVIVDRMGDVMELTGGMKFSPQYIENKLKFSPYIREAIVLGHRMKYVAALIQIDMDVVGKWAEDRQIPYTTFEDLSQKSEVFQLISTEISRLNQKLPELARVASFHLLSKELDPEDDELTQTQKLRRTAILHKYAAQVQSLYPGEEISPRS